MFSSASHYTSAEWYVNVSAPFHKKAQEPIALRRQKNTNNFLYKKFEETYLTTYKIDIICILKKCNSIQLPFADRSFTNKEVPNPLSHIHVGTN